MKVSSSVGLSHSFSLSLSHTHTYTLCKRETLDFLLPLIHASWLIKTIEEMEEHPEGTAKPEHRQSWSKGVQDGACVGGVGATEETTGTSGGPRVSSAPGSCRGSEHSR